MAPAFHFKLLCAASAGALNLKKGGFQGEVLARPGPGPGREPVGGPEALLTLRRRGGPGTRQQYPMDATQAAVHVELRESERWPETEARARRSRGYSSMPVFGNLADRAAALPVHEPGRAVAVLAPDPTLGAPPPARTRGASPEVNTLRSAPPCTRAVAESVAACC